MPPVVVGAVSLAGASVAAGGFTAALAASGLIGAAANFGASMLLSGVAQKLAGKPNTGSVGVESTQVSMSAPISAREIAYGEVRKGGILVFVDTSGGSAGSGGSSMLHMVMVVAAHKVSAIKEIYFDGELAFHADGTPAARVLSGSTARAWVEKRLGDDDQTAFDGLRSWLPSKWTANHRLRGCAAIYLRIEFNSEVFPQGVPNVTCVVRGKSDIYDPRTESYGWTDNPALCLADYMSSSRFGIGALIGVDGGQNEDSLIEAANVCDEIVAKPGARGTEKRYTCNGVVDAYVAPQQVIQSMLTAMAGHVIRKAGQWYIQAGAWRPPSLTLGDNDASGGLQLVTRLSRSENFNGVRGTFISPENDWQPDDFPAYQSSVYVGEDSGIEVWRDISLPFTTSPYTAQRLAKIELEQARRQLSIDWPAHLSALAASAGDTVALSRARWGMAAKPFAVAGMRFESISDGIGVRPVLSLSETSPLIWDWDADEAQIYAAAPRTNLPSAWHVAPVGITSVSEELYVTRASDGVKTRTLIKWSTSASGYAYRYILQAAYEGGPWRDVADTRATEAVHEDVSRGSWVYRIQAVSALGAVSAWTSYAVEIYGTIAPPEALQGATLQTAGGLAIIKWQLSEDLDVRFGGRVVIRHSGALVPSWSSSIQLDEVTGNQTIATVPLMPGTYYVRPIDAEGHFGPASALPTDGATALGYVSAGSLQADSAFTGTHAGTVVEGGTLRLPILSGEVASSGLYTFDEALDLGSVKRVRLRSIIDLANAVVGDLIDSRAGLVDDWLDWDGVEGADCNVQMQVRWTLHDPNGSPQWSDWSRLDASEIAARGIEARALITAQNPIVQPIIAKLRVQVDEVG